MPRNPERTAEARAWFGKAANDLRAAELDIGAAPPLLEDALFHCQQATEKSLKGFLFWNDSPFSKTHSLEKLGEQCLALDNTLRALVDRAVPLTQYVWKFRYPGEPEPPTVDEAKEALLLAREVYEAVLSRLPGEVRL